MTQTLLAIENLSVGFRHQQTVRTVVNDACHYIEAGETLALVGESGSGKSVTALSILRLLLARRLNISRRYSFSWRIAASCQRSNVAPDVRGNKSP